ncbi:hypothetical protein E1A91_A10G120600v1 [Gossypium mustelinum]|uniref:Uncharacterized protein n=1 Tax=Gossypium mustelinum TaxID=34275 RepID=A0A5D2XLE0_GOSMU|nr:hypothetical protein E1A91_A10G120600v1 [Gossypium mustelinum]
MTLGPVVRDGEHVFSVAHTFASFNHSFITMVRITGGMKVKADRDEHKMFPRDARNSELRHSISNYVLQEVTKPRPLVRVLSQLSGLLLALG